MLTEGMFIADRYEIINKIGAGGMSDVYKAKDHVLGRFVAIKVLKTEFSEDINFVTKFHTEAQSAAGLEHPNIVNIYDVGSEDGIHYIVMEYIEGITLKTYIEKKGHLSFKEAISIAIQVGRGIEAAHNKNIVHRDIKPQNIMISTEGKVKVTDFGIARAASSNTIHSDVMGSVHYSSPEQARNGFIDGKSDIYSLGIVMYEMVTGRVPFDGDTTVAVAIQHLQEEMVPPSVYAPDLPISLEKIILKCTQKSPSRRYQTMGDLISDLKRALVNPNEDFVTMVPLMNQDKTRVVSEEELSHIKGRTEQYEPQDTYSDADYEEDGYEDDGYDDEEYYEDGEYEDDYEEDGYEDGEYDEEYYDEEDDNAGGLNPKMEKAVTIMGIVVAIIIVFIIIYLVGSFFGLFKFGGSSSDKTTTQTESEIETETETEEESETQKDSVDMVSMIDVKGMTYEEAKAALNKKGLGIFKNGTQSSDEYEEGEIISQDIEEGDKVEKNTTVKVIISSGAGSITVPDVTGSSSANATSKLESAGFKVSTDYKYSDSVAQGNVVGTSPAAGTSAKKGETVTIYLSRGAESTPMPNLIGQTEEQAKNTLSQMGCTVNVNTEYNSTQEAGKVVGQSIDPGNAVTSGTTVTIAISKGQQTYYYKATITAPSNASPDNPVVGANITLTGADGSNIYSQSGVDIGSFPYTLEANSIKGNTSGTLSIIWILQDGSQSQQNSNVTFSPSN
ncbi:MAG: Stk1 family PASTA domain-containing Ser/Thr kinase [Lachnospiraceae bacterium]|nr:Stk1 family PASTA domain-containing Ser/Thr kinase [Lachnospiraceae bacterium]MDD6170492.1 Stk1 family PASTA domain-containing Ser/Thr kinase [Lachnospiraceae bacterium]MDY4838198.1 Stk1 family PASTA domain-containing Ser/Thr kinase [Lachnospiraceae bacterium]